MTTMKDTASAATPTTGNRGRYLRGFALADRKASEYGWADRPARVGEGKYRVPSCTTYRRYRVDVNAGTCECYDRYTLHTCKHLICAMILESRRRVRMARVVSCDGCTARVPSDQTVEVVDDGLNAAAVTHFEGDRICGECARRVGLS